MCLEKVKCGLAAWMAAHCSFNYGDVGSIPTEKSLDWLLSLESFLC